MLDDFHTNPRATPQTGGRTLTAIKTLHTVIWIAMVGCIVGVPIAASLRHFYLSLILATVVLGECLVLAVNGGRCPLTDLASLYSDDPAENFDIYLPLWLARRNKTIFGSLFVAGGFLAFALWLASRNS